MEMYALKIKDVFDKLDTDEKGLSSDEANNRLNKYGKNIIGGEHKGVGRSHIFFEQWANPLILILIFAGVVSFFLGEHLDAYIILGTALVNVLVGFIQEDKANRSLEKLRSMIRFDAVILRDGHKKLVPSEDIVIGDVLFLSAGDKVQADARIFKLTDFEVNESTLTGESELIKKQIKPTATGVSVGDRRSMVHRGTVISKGEAYCVVTATGVATELGQITSLVEKTVDDETPLQKQLGHLGRQISILVTVIIIAVVIIGHFSVRIDYSFLQLFQTAVALAVAAIPEGLVISLTVILAIGMQCILKRGSLVRRLVATETLGSVSVICTDKTGTLTEGQMKLASITTVDDEISQKKLKNLVIDSYQPKNNFERAILVGTLTNTATIENYKSVDKSSKVIGDSTDIALLYAGYDAGINIDKLNEVYEEVSNIPFTSENMYTASLRKNGEINYIAVKGAPEVIINRCSYYLGKDGNKLLFDDKIKDIILDKQKKLAVQGFRVIGIAERIIPNISKKLEKDIFELTFIGLMALRDPIRKDVASTIKIAHKAHIKVIMITGDHKDTAFSIAKEIGLTNNEDDVLEGKFLENLSLVDLKATLQNVRVFARVEPKHKIAIVEALQSMGEVVAMTGDGVNDAPALKGADVGIALGSGTDVAKETADLVLINDSIGTIVSAVEEGRRIYQNIKKVVFYLITGSFSQVLIVVGAILTGFPIPLTPVQILWGNIIEDTFLSIALSFDRGDKDNMKDKPRDKNEKLIDNELKVATLAKSVLGNIVLFGIFVYIYTTTKDLALARTMVFVGFSIDSLFFIFSVRSLRKMIWQVNILDNLYLLGAVGFCWVLLLSAVYFPPFSALLRTVPLTLDHWLILLMFGVWVVTINEVVKYVFIARNK